MTEGMDFFSSAITSNDDTADTSKRDDGKKLEAIDVFGVSQKEDKEVKVVQSAMKEDVSHSKVISTHSKKIEVETGTESELDLANQLLAQKTEKKSNVVLRQDSVNRHQSEDEIDEELLNTFSNFVGKGSEEGVTEDSKEKKEKDFEEKIEKQESETEPKQEKKQENILLFRHSEPSKIAMITDRAKYHLLEKRFTTGQLVIALDEEQKPMFQLYKLGNELMAYRYLGTSLNVRIPAYVGNLPVRYVHSRFFTGDLDLVSRTGLKSIKESLKGTGILEMNTSVIKDSLKGVQSVIFPETLVELPARLFQYCYSIQEIVVPANVKHVSEWFLYMSGIKHVYFNGECPEEFRSCMTNHDFFVYLPKGNKEFSNDLND